MTGPFVGTTDASGKVGVVADPGTYSVSIVPPAGFVVPPAQQAVVSSGVDTAVRFQLAAIPGTILVVVVGPSGAPVAGVAVTVK